MKGGLLMRFLQRLQTSWNRISDFTGKRVRMLVRISSGRYEALSIVWFLLLSRLMMLNSEGISEKSWKALGILDKYEVSCFGTSRH